MCAVLEIFCNQNLWRNCTDFRLLPLVFKSLDCFELPHFSLDQKNDVQVFRLFARSLSYTSILLEEERMLLTFVMLARKYAAGCNLGFERKWSLTWLFAFYVAYVWPGVTTWKVLDEYYPGCQVLVVLGWLLKQEQQDSECCNQHSSDNPCSYSSQFPHHLWKMSVLNEKGVGVYICYLRSFRNTVAFYLTCKRLVPALIDRNEAVISGSQTHSGCWLSSSVLV